MYVLGSRISQLPGNCMSWRMELGGALHNLLDGILFWTRMVSMRRQLNTSWLRLADIEHEYTKYEEEGEDENEEASRKDGVHVGLADVASHCVCYVP